MPSGNRDTIRHVNVIWFQKCYVKTDQNIIKAEC